MGLKKVLITGEVNGRLKELFSRVTAVNKSAGPFDLLLCTGSFIKPKGVQEAIESFLKLVESYVSGALEVPVPTYFFGLDGEIEERLLTVLERSSSHRLHYLGNSGLTRLQGLSVAFLSEQPTEVEVNALEKAINAAEGDIDFYLTCSWPLNIAVLTAPGNTVDTVSKNGSKTAADLALKVRPRYHIATGGDVFFARAPYSNKDLGAGSHVTRFIGLAAVGNSGKQKSLHALGLQPASQMDPVALQQKPAGTTACPYTLATKRPVDEISGGQDWRWQDPKKMRTAQPSLGRPDVVKDNRKTVFVGNLPYAATEEDVISFFSACGAVADVRRGLTNGKLNSYAFVQFEGEEAAVRATEMGEAVLMGRQLNINTANRGPEEQRPSGEPVQGCWFCLSSQTVDTSLIVSIGEEVYLAADKGPITAEHVLILPIEHRANSLDLSPPAFAELERYLSALRSCFASKGLELIAFERYMLFKSKGGNHLQFNVLSIPASTAKTAKAVYLAAAKKEGFVLQTLDGPQSGEAGRAALRDAVGSGEFFQVLLPDGSRLLQAISPANRHPMPFGREAAAQLAGVPHRASWKNCQVDQAAEEAMTAKFKKLFEPYDVMG